MEQIIFKNGLALNIVGATPTSVSLESTADEVSYYIKLFTEDNLASYQIKNTAGNESANYQNKKFESSRFADGVLTISLADVNETEKKLKDLEEKNNMLTECILEMSQVVYAAN